MKFRCNTKELSDALVNIQHAVSSKSSLPVLEGILLRASDGTLSLFSYDLEIGMTTTVAASVGEPGEIVLNARLFTEMTRRLPTENVDISSDEKLLTTIRSGVSEFTILGIPASEFPEMPSLNDGVGTTLPQEVLLSMIRQTRFAISSDDSKPVYMGSRFEFEKDHFRVISIDGNRLAIRTEPVSGATEINFVVPGKTLTELSKLLNPESEEDARVSIGKRHILFEINGYSIISRLLEGDFLDFRSVVGKQFGTTVRVNVQAFLESVERASLLISDKLKSPLRCIFQKDVIKIICNTSIGKAYDEIPCSLEGPDVEIGFNNRYLIDALRSCECDEVRVELNGALSPMKICPPEGENFLFLVLPVRLKNE